MTSNPYATPETVMAAEPGLALDGKPERYTRVGGWLLFLCISLTVLTPLANLLSILANVLVLPAVMKRFPDMRYVVMGQTLLILTATVFAIVAGIRLWTLHPKAVGTAKLFLVVNVVVVALTVMLPGLGGLPDAAGQALGVGALMAVFRSGVYAFIWFSYLSKSVRVARTYDLAVLV